MRLISLQRVVRVLVLVGGISLVGCSAPSEGTPIPTAPEQAQGWTGLRVVAIGDIHGDFHSAEKALWLAGVMDADYRWIGGETVLVQVGDILDRGDDERDILDLFERLSEEASAVGGQVIPLLGNHEIITVAGVYDFATEGTCEGFTDLEGLDLNHPALADLTPSCQKRGAAFLPGGPFAKKLADHPVAAIVGDSLFVHGGVFPAHVSYGLDRINQETQAWMRGESQEPPIAIGYTTNSMVWTRSFSDGDVPEAACELLTEILDELELSRLVVAHTVQETINSSCDGKVWRIDTGMSAYFGGAVEVLEILEDGIRVVY